MNFKDKLKLFFKNFFNDNKYCFLTLFIIFILALFSQSVNASSADLINYDSTMEIVGNKEYCIYENSTGDIFMVIPVKDYLCHYNYNMKAIYSWDGSNTFWTRIGGCDLYKLNISTGNFEFLTTYTMKSGGNYSSEFLSEYRIQNYLYAKTDLYDVYMNRTIFTANPLPLPTFQLFVSTTEITDLFVTIKTQEFSEDFINTHKVYYSYKEDINGNSIWYPASLTSSGYYYTTALENGVYKFKLTDLEGNVLSSSTMNITNIQKVTEAQDSSVIIPILSVEPSSNEFVYVKTQTFSEDLINRYRCFFWKSGQTPDSKIEIFPTKLKNNNYYFYTTTEEDETFYFVFYDKELNKYSDIVNLNIVVENVFNNPIYSGQQTSSNLLKQKFGLFYSAVNFLTEFWDIITSEEAEIPSFSFTMPDFLGGNTYEIFNLEIYDKYKDYVHYIMAGFIYFFYIKRLTKTIPDLINEVSG